MNIRVTAILVLYILATSLGQDFKSHESGLCQFRLQGCELTPPVERALVAGVSHILETYQQSFGFEYPDVQKIKVVIFADKDKFVEYQKTQGKENIADYAYYSARFREAVVHWPDASKKTKDAKEMVATVYHEVSHMLLMVRVPWVPQWINEGLAEYFEGLNMFGKNRRVYLNKAHQSWLKHWDKKGFPVELKEFVSFSFDEFYKFDDSLKHRDAGYVIGYSLVYFMMSRSATEAVLKELLWAFKDQGKDVDSYETIDGRYPGGFEKFEAQWRKWIPKARSYRTLRVLRTDSEAKPDKSAAQKTTADS